MNRAPRTKALLHAAVAVAAEDGLRGLTHRAVDARADLPVGSTSYYYRTREALLSALLEYIAEQELTEIDNVSEAIRASRTVRQIADQIAGVLALWVGPARSRTRVRLEICLLSTDRPEYRAVLERVSERFADHCRAAVSAVAAVGDRRQDDSARFVVACIEGLTYDAVARSGRRPRDQNSLRADVERILGAATA